MYHLRDPYKWPHLPVVRDLFGRTSASASKMPTIDLAQAQFEHKAAVNRDYIAQPRITYRCVGWINCELIMIV